MLFAIYLHLNLSTFFINDFVSSNNMHNSLDYNIMVAGKHINEHCMLN